MVFFKINSFPFTSVLQFIATDFWKAGLHRFEKQLIYNSDPLRYCFKQTLVAKHLLGNKNMLKFFKFCF